LGFTALGVAITSPATAPYSQNGRGAGQNLTRPGGDLDCRGAKGLVRVPAP